MPVTASSMSKATFFKFPIPAWTFMHFLSSYFFTPHPHPPPPPTYIYIRIIHDSPSTIPKYMYQISLEFFLKKRKRKRKRKKKKKRLEFHKETGESLDLKNQHTCTKMLQHNSLLNLFL